jgi:hypothetical protein
VVKGRKNNGVAFLKRIDLNLRVFMVSVTAKSLMFFVEGTFPDSSEGACRNSHVS